MTAKQARAAAWSKVLTRLRTELHIEYRRLYDEHTDHFGCGNRTLCVSYQLRREHLERAAVVYGEELRERGLAPKGGR